MCIRPEVTGTDDVGLHCVDGRSGLQAEPREHAEDDAEEPSDRLGVFEIAADDDPGEAQQDLPGDARQDGTQQQVAGGDGFRRSDPEGGEEQADVDGGRERVREDLDGEPTQSGQVPRPGQRRGNRGGDGADAEQAEQAEGPQVVGREAGPGHFRNVPDGVERVLYRVGQSLPAQDGADDADDQRRGGVSEGRGSDLGPSTPALIIGIIGAILGGQGLANAIQNTFNTVWNVPKVARPGFPSNYLRTFGLLGLLGVSAVATAVTASLAGAGNLPGLSGLAVKILAYALSTAIDIGLFFAAFRIATAKTVATRDLLLGAILSSIAWQILLSFAGIIISRDLKHAQAVAGFFGVVLGMLAWFGLQATATVYAVEADVVRARHLWPRSITQPPLTTADRRVLQDTAQVETRRPEQRVNVEFTAQADHDPLHQPELPTEKQNPQ